jgi:hypothetical protein
MHDRSPSCRPPRRLRGAFVLLAASALALPCAAEELGFLGGAAYSNRTGNHSGVYAIDYQEDFGALWALGGGYVNEGHAANDHRDGVAFQLRVRASVFDPRLTLTAGAGPFYYFNTTRAQSGASDSIDHGWGVIYSLAATWDLGRAWYLQARVQHIDARSGFDTTGVLVGGGYRFGGAGSFAGSLAPDDALPRHELSVLAGTTIANTFRSETAFAQAIEYRGRLRAPLEWTLTALNEGDTGPVRRNGVVAQLWGVHALNERLGVAAGVGPYVLIGLHRDEPQHDEAEDRLAGVASLMLAYQLAPAWRAKLMFNRVFAQHSRDTDVLLLGVGRRF